MEVADDAFMKAGAQPAKMTVPEARCEIHVESWCGFQKASSAFFPAATNACCARSAGEGE